MQFAILLGKLSRWFIRLFRPGGGSSIPGKLALSVAPSLIARLRSQVGVGVIAVSGSAGKSTTTKLIVSILRSQGLQVFTNESTANIEQGLASSLVRASSLSGRLSSDVWVLELDEGHASKLAPLLKPDICVLTNLMTDQLDRFDDPEVVLEKLQELAIHSKTLVINADDPHLLGIQHPSRLGFAADQLFLEAPDAPELAPYFGDPAENSLPAEVIVIPTPNNQLNIHFGGKKHLVSPQLMGTHNALNIAAAWLASSQFLGSRSDSQSVISAIENTPPVFARDEILTIRGRTVRLVLVQNPGSFRLNLRRLGALREPLMIAIGSDVHDPSWIWSIDFGQFSRVQVAAGLNARQLALWLFYQGIEVDQVIVDMADAADTFLDGLVGSSCTIVVTADAMRRFRRHLRLAK